MHNKVLEWMNHPLSSIFLRVLEKKKERAYQTLLSGPENRDRDRLIEELKVYNQILDLDRLFEGELEEASNDREV